MSPPGCLEGGERRLCQELTHQRDDEGEAMQQPMQDFGCALGLVPEDAVNQQGYGVRKGEGPLTERQASLPGQQETHLGGE